MWLFFMSPSLGLLLAFIGWGPQCIPHNEEFSPFSRTSGVLPDITYVVKTSEPGTELHYI